MRVTIGNKCRNYSRKKVPNVVKSRIHPAFSPKKQMVILFQSVCKTLLNEVFAKLCSVTLHYSGLASNPF